MILIETKQIPERRNHVWHNLREVFEGFIDMNVEIANVVIDYTDGEYQNPHSAYNALHRASKRHSDLKVRVVSRGCEIYLVRTDM